MSMEFEGRNLPLSDSALHLLRSAGKYVNDETTEISIWHILLIALTDPETPAYHILRRDIEDERLESLVTHVKNRVQEPAGSHIGNLGIYIQACSEVAREEYHIEINDTLILWQILQKNLSVSSLFLSHGIDSHQLQQSLQETTTLRQSTEPLSLFRSARETIPALAIPEIWRNVTPIYLTRDIFDSTPLEQINPNMHSVTRDSLAAALNSILTLQRDCVVMFAGPNGSAIDFIEYLLAYWIGQTESPLAGQPRTLDLLSGYELWKVSLTRFLDLVRRRRLPIDLLLNYLKQEAGQHKAILLLTDLESVPYDGLATGKIRKQLSQPDDACIIGVYKYSSVKRSEEEWKFGLDNAIPVSAENMEDKTQVYEFIHEYHAARWAKQGYTVDDQTFDSLFALEKGVWVFHKRKTWPYLGIDLVDDCIRSVQKGKQSIRDMALDARIAIRNILTKEALKIKDVLRAELEPTLQAAQERIEALCDKQDLPVEGEYTVISQAMMEVQLFCRNNSEYHFPGIHP